MSLGARYYRLLLRLLPREFREAFGADMLGVFEEMRTERFSRGLLRAMVGFYLRLTLDVARRIGPERRRVRRRKRGARTERAGSLATWAGSVPGHGIETLLTDVRLALRRMARSPGFTAVALVSLAVGIGANTATFALVEDFLFPSFPYRAPEELVDVYVELEEFPFAPLSYPDYLDVREGTKDVFSDMGLGGFAFGQVDEGDRVESLLGEMVSGSFFPTLGMGAALGRTLLPEDDVSPGSYWVVMLGYGYWQRKYGGDAGVLGETLVLNGHGYTIVGVASEDYPGIVQGVPADFIAPVAMAKQLMQTSGEPLMSRGSQSYFTKARLRPGVSPSQAEATLAGIAAHLKETYPENWDAGRRLIAFPTTDVIMNPVLDRVLVPAAALALVLVGVVLLIACSNLASFLLARGPTAGRRSPCASPWADPAARSCASS